MYVIVIMSKISIYIDMRALMTYFIYSIGLELGQ